MNQRPLNHQTRNAQVQQKIFEMNKLEELMESKEEQYKEELTTQYNLTNFLEEKCEKLKEELEECKQELAMLKSEPKSSRIANGCDKCTQTEDGILEISKSIAMSKDTTEETPSTPRTPRRPLSSASFRSSRTYMTSQENESNDPLYTALESLVSSKLDVQSLNQFLDHLIALETELKKKQSIEAWTMLLKIATLEERSKLLSLDGEVVKYNIQKREEIVKKIEKQVATVLNVWKRRKKAYNAIRIKVRNMFMHYVIEILRSNCTHTNVTKNETSFESGVEGNSMGKDVNSIVKTALESFKANTFSFLKIVTHLDGVHALEWYDGLMTNIDDQKTVLSHSEKLRIDTITPVLQFNFSQVRFGSFSNFVDDRFRAENSDKRYRRICHR